MLLSGGLTFKIVIEFVLIAYFAIRLLSLLLFRLLPDRQVSKGVSYFDSTHFPTPGMADVCLPDGYDGPTCQREGRYPRLRPWGCGAGVLTSGVAVRTIRHPRPRNNGRAAEIAAHNSPWDTWLRILASPLHPRTICYPATASTTDILWSPVPVGIGGIWAWNCLTNRNGVPLSVVLYGINGEKALLTWNFCLLFFQIILSPRLLII